MSNKHIKNSVQEREVVGFVSSGRLNYVTGWTLLLMGLSAAACLDPWLFSERDPLAILKSQRIVVRHAQGVVFGMAFLQLGVANLLAIAAFSDTVRRTAAWLTALGAALYAAGYALSVQWPIFTGLILCGSLMNLSAFIFLVWVGPTGGESRVIKLVLPVVCFGMLLDLITGLFIGFPEQFVPAYLGSDDDVRLRMMRLARVAVIALSVLTLLYQRLAYRVGSPSRIVGWGHLGMLCGTIGMPAILAASCFTFTQLKFLLPIPASSILAGVLVALGVAFRHAGFLERCGWLLVAVSMSVGLLMGLYAFDGPFATPDFLGAYNEYARRLFRLAHSYCIVLGMLSIFVSHKLEQVPNARWTARVGVPLFVVANIATIGLILLQMVVDLPVSALSVGPALVVIATILCIAGAVNRA